MAVIESRRAAPPPLILALDVGTSTVRAILFDQLGRMIDDIEGKWEQIMAINLKGVFLTCQIFGKQMLVQQFGNIINISYMASGPPLSKVFTYSVSKAGLNNLTQNIAREWAGQGIRVNAILPGFFPAEQNKKRLTPERKTAIFRHTPMGSFGESSELIGTLLWLAADKASSFVTGTLIQVDGGFSAMSI